MVIYFSGCVIFIMLVGLLYGTSLLPLEDGDEFLIWFFLIAIWPLSIVIAMLVLCVFLLFFVPYILGKKLKKEY